MSLSQWEMNGWLKPHKTDDWKFGIAYNAVLKLCTLMLYATGYRPENTLAHYRTLMAIEYTIGAHRKDDAAYLNACRIKRNTVEYDNVGRASSDEAKELLAFTKELRLEILSLLQKNHPDLL